MKLTNIQEQKLNLLLNSYFNQERGIYFKAPTGSGKTFIIANFIDQILSQKLQNEKIIFIIGTISSSELPRQMKEKLDYYQNYLINKFDSIFIESPSNTKKIEKDICNLFKIPLYDKNLNYILGTSSFTKGSLFYKYKCFLNFIKELKNNKFKIIYIRDEAHIGAKERDKLSKNWEKENNESLDNLLNENSDFILKLTATPKLDNLDQIILAEDELEEDNKKLIKKYFKRYDNVDQDVNDQELLLKSIEEYKIIQKKYKNSPLLSKYNINPAMIIQVSSNNNFNYDKNNSFRDDIENIKKTLDSKNIRWVLYFGDKKEQSNLIRKNKLSLLEISKNDSEVEVIIIKIGPSIGWDIPRACMLIQLRNVFSETLNVQTVGRIKRNPLPTLEDDNLARTYWLYSNYQESRTEMANYRLEDKYFNELYKNNISFYSGRINISAKKDKQYENKIFFLFKEEMIISGILDEIKDFKNNYFKNKWNILILERIKNSESKIISKHYKEINSYFDLYKITKKVNFGNDLMKCIEKYWNENLNIKNLIDLIQFQYIIYKMTNLFSLLKEKIQKIKKEFIQSKNYQINFDNKILLPKEFIIWKRKNIGLSEDEKVINYKDLLNIFPYRNQDKSEKNILYLDSKNEIGIINNFQELYKELIRFEQYIDWLNLKDLKLFSINPALTSKINFEYLNYENEYKKSYPDWLIKYKDIDLYIEFKSENDYDSKKTENLKEAYKYYSINQNKNYFGLLIGKKEIRLNNDKYGSIKEIYLYKNGKEKLIKNLGGSTNLLIEILKYVNENIESKNNILITKKSLVNQNKQQYIY